MSLLPVVIYHKKSVKMGRIKSRSVLENFDEMRNVKGRPIMSFCIHVFYAFSILMLIGVYALMIQELYKNVQSSFSWYFFRIFLFLIFFTFIINYYNKSKMF